MTLSLRNKLLIIFVAFGVVPGLLAVGFNYFAGAGGVESVLRAESEVRVARVARRAADTVTAHEKRLADIAAQKSLGDYMRGAQPAGAAASAEGGTAVASEMPAVVHAHLIGLFRRGGVAFEFINGYKAGGQRLFRVSRGADGEPRVETGVFAASEALYNQRVWETARVEPFRAGPAMESHGWCMSTAVPVFDGAAGASPPIGALVLEMRPPELLKDAIGAAAAAPAGGDTLPPSTVVALDNRTGALVYHVNEAYVLHETRLPYFEPVAAGMRAGGAGRAWFRSPEGDRWLASYRQIEGLPVSLAVAGNYDAAAAPVRSALLQGAGLVLLLGATGAALLLRVATRTTRRIDRVAAAIKNGGSERPLDLSMTGETRALAEGVIKMNDELRELIRREAESKQFESFTRLSAMLTHDLKNAISGLALLVSNMEKHMHREEFRRDAVTSLRVATEKLKRIVAKLNEPVKSLSGEYRRDAREIDLVEVIRRVLATNAEPSVPLYQIKTSLPESLVAVVEPERIENVLENLVINALEAMGAAGGTLTVEAGKDEGNLIFFSVADTGVGMDEQFIRLRLYRPFSTTKQKGIGLGLFTCREIVEAHGGALTVESKPGAGTRFRVVLPSRLFASGERFKSRSSEGPVGI